MFFRPKRGRRGPHILFIRDSEEPIRLDEARLVAWVAALGRGREAERPAFRPHRGELPDVDVSRAVPVTPRAGLLSRLFGWLAGRGHDSAQAPGETDTDAVALGESPRKPYVWEVEAESKASDADDGEPDVEAVEYNGSRAA